MKIIYLKIYKKKFSRETTYLFIKGLVSDLFEKSEYDYGFLVPSRSQNIQQALSFHQESKNLLLNMVMIFIRPALDGN